MTRYLVVSYDNEVKSFLNNIFDTDVSEVKMYHQLFMEKKTEDTIFSEFLYQKVFSILRSKNDKEKRIEFKKRFSIVNVIFINNY